MKVKRAIFIMVIVTTLVASCLVGCGEKTEKPAVSSETPSSTSEKPAPASEASAPEEREVINIGIVTSISGTGSSIGMGQRRAAELAIEDVNASGGVVINGVTYNFAPISVDDETKPEIAIRRVNEMKREQGVTCVLGGSLGNISTALNVEAMDNSFLFMASNGVPEIFYEKDAHSDTAMCITTVSEWMGRGAAAYMMGQAGAKKIACLMPDYSIGQGTQKGFEQIAEKYPDVEFEVIWHPVDTPDLSSYIIKARDMKPDFLFVGSWANDAITALKQINEMGVKNEMKVMHFWLMDEFATGIPAEAIDGVYAQMFWYHDMSAFEDSQVVEETKRLTDKYFKKHGEPLGPYAMSSYYAVMEIKRAMELAQSTEPVALQKALKENPEFYTAKGRAVWREDGVPVYDYSSWIVEGLGIDERTNTPYGAEFDFAKVFAQVEGEDFVPPLN
jgi:branched-chain amino acid transport system substrate-binding protein